MAGRKYFIFDYPLLGTKRNPSNDSQLMLSPYFWWWAYLRRNKAYLLCCEREGKGKLSTLYEDFGDVRGDDFREWWGRKLSKGDYLFAERSLDFYVKRLGSKDEWDSDWSDANVAVVAVNLKMQSKRDIQKYFAGLLKQIKPEKRGKKAVPESSARYQLCRNVTQQNLQVMLTIFDAVEHNKALPKDQRKTLWQIGEEFRLVRTAMTNPNDLPSDAMIKRHVMSNTVTRYYKRAKKIIDNTSLGRFPDG
jgi:hypothetical protein